MRIVKQATAAQLYDDGISWMREGSTQQTELMKKNKYQGMDADTTVTIGVNDNGAVSVELR